MATFDEYTQKKKKKQQQKQSFADYTKKVLSEDIAPVKKKSNNDITPENVLGKISDITNQANQEYSKKQAKTAKKK